MAKGGLSLRSCMHALRGSAADRASVDALAPDIARLRLADDEAAGFRAGLADLRRIDLRLDRIMEARLSPQGAYALGLCVALYARAGLRIQDESPRRAAPVLREVAELIPVALVALQPGSEPAPEGVEVRLTRLRGRIEAAGIDTGTFGRAPAISKADIAEHRARSSAEPTARSIPVATLVAVILGGLAVLAGLAFALRGGEEPVDLALHQDIVPAREITRRSGEVLVRVPPTWGVEDRPMAEAAALLVWRREIGEADDSGVTVSFTTGQGRVVATVQDGTVQWTQ